MTTRTTMRRTRMTTRTVGPGNEERFSHWTILLLRCIAFVETQSGSLKPRHSYVGTRFPIVETRVDFFLSNGHPPSRILLSSASEKRAQTNGRTTRIFRAQHLLPHTHQMVSSSSVPKLTPHRFTNKLTKVPCDNPARFTP